MDTHAVIVAETDGRIIQWNDAAETLFGHPAEDAIGHSLNLIVRVDRDGTFHTDWSGDRVERPA